jgi:hypothetical protein
VSWCLPNLLPNQSQSMITCTVHQAASLALSRIFGQTAIFSTPPIYNSTDTIFQAISIFIEFYIANAHSTVGKSTKLV